MSDYAGTSGARQQRRAGYLDRLPEAAGHAGCVDPVRLCCTGLLRPGEHKIIEPIAAVAGTERIILGANQPD